MRVLCIGALKCTFGLCKLAYKAISPLKYWRTCPAFHKKFGVPVRGYLYVLRTHYEETLGHAAVILQDMLKAWMWKTGCIPSSARTAVHQVQVETEALIFPPAKGVQPVLSHA
eukprot:1140244-Pelagomonas_calceolata.AAC.2